MLDSLMAQKLANKIMKQLGYNINIMNEKGIIVGSGDSSRLGDFHEIAYKIVKNKSDIQIARGDDEKYIGVKPGVNMPIMYADRPIGVLGISGDPDEILNFAYVVKMAVETMVEYEFYKDQSRKRQSSKNVLLKSLFYEDPFNSEKTEKLAKQLEYDTKLIRIPIFIHVFSSQDMEWVLEAIKASSTHSKQDISLIVDNEHVIIFKVLGKNQVKGYMQKAQQYIEEINKVLLNSHNNPRCMFYVATPQNALKHYRNSFQLCLWLEAYTSGQDGNTFFIMDFIVDYMKSLIPSDVLKSIFSIYEDFLDSNDISAFIETMDALYKTDINVNKAAELLYLHRNTILFRLNKIKDQFGVNPLKSFADQQFLSLLLYFYKSYGNI